MTTPTRAFGLIDAQRGFMPAEEGQRINQTGFGELGVPHGERIVPKVNALLGTYALRGLAVFTTQDYHPIETAHFDDEPNFNTTWPVHCVGGTPGAELHPEVKVPEDAQAFYKGAVRLAKGEDDTSYSGYNANRFGDDLELPKWLQNNNITEVAIGGLALDYCVKATALDLRQKMDLDVVLITDATQPVTQETGLTAINELEAAGVRFVTTDEWLRVIEATAE